MDTVEKVARALCKSDGVDPEKNCVGVGRIIPKGETWKAWEVRREQAKAAIEAMKNLDSILEVGGYTRK